MNDNAAPFVRAYASLIELFMMRKQRSFRLTNDSPDKSGMKLSND